MTLRRVAKIGLAANLVPFLNLPVTVALATILGQPTGTIPWHWAPSAAAEWLAWLSPAPLAIFQFLLYRAATGRGRPGRLEDAALLAGALTLAEMAVALRWSNVGMLVRGPWPQLAHHAMTMVVGRWAWLLLLIAFLRAPAPPVGRGHRIAALVLAVATLASGVWPLYELSANVIIFFWLNFPPRGDAAFFTWIGPISGLIDRAAWLLTLVFALSLWRTRDTAAEPRGGNAAS